MNRFAARENRRMQDGFTLVELLVVTAIIGILAGILLPVLVRARARAQAVICMNNTRQLSVAWIMYSDDNNGRLAYNLGIGARTTSSLQFTSMDGNWADNILNWDVANTDNTNSLKLISSGLGPYAGKSASLYRCPSDFVLDRSQQEAGWDGRVRSYSMNAMVGDAGNFTASGFNVNNPGYVQFFKMSSIPRPSEVFVFVDEHPDSIDDGYFVNRVEDHEWHDLPASYHNGGASLAYADGHGETHRWQNESTRRPARPGGAALPIQLSKGQMRDFYWVISRMSIEKSGSSHSY